VAQVEEALQLEVQIALFSQLPPVPRFVTGSGLTPSFQGLASLCMESRDIRPSGGPELSPVERLTPEWRAALDAGVDMSLVELSLARTPTERIQDHDRALVFMQRLSAGVRTRK
jgi:hypothetical protein